MFFRKTPSEKPWMRPCLGDKVKKKSFRRMTIKLEVNRNSCLFDFGCPLPRALALSFDVLYFTKLPQKFFASLISILIVINIVSW